MNKSKIILYLFYLALSISFIVVLLPIIIRFFLPFIIASLISIIVEPIIRTLEKKLKLNRTVSSIITLTSIFGILIYLLVIVLSRLIFEFARFINYLPIYYNKAEDFIGNLLIYVEEIIVKLPDGFINDYEYYMNTIYQSLEELLTNLTETFLAAFSIFPGFLIFVIVTFIASYFLCKDKELISESLYQLLPIETREKVRIIQLDIIVSLFNIFKSQLILVLIQTIITIAGFYLLRVEYALIVGIICGVLDFIPIIGPSLIFLPWLAYSFFFGEFIFGILLFIHFIVILSSRQYLQAKIIGEKIGIHPILTLISIYVGLRAFGVLGLLIGPVIIVVIRAIIKSDIISFNWSDFRKG